MPAISVALCTYNGAAYIGEQIASILGQTLLPSEIVVADDGSTDTTLQQVRQLCEAAGMPLRILPPEGRLGVTKNFERALLASAGDLIALCDQDDIWHPTRVQQASDAFQAQPRLLLNHSDARLVDGSGNPLGLTLEEALLISHTEREAICNGSAFTAYLRRNLVTGATTMIRRDLLTAATPIPTTWVHDEWLGIIAAATGAVSMLHDPLIDYRQHGSNEIGATKPTLRYRIGRMLEPRGSRYRDLRDRAADLAERLDQLDAPLKWRNLAHNKARFEKIRADLPTSRIKRIRPVLAELRAGSYAELSSQGNTDVLRDLLQPA